MQKGENSVTFDRSLWKNGAGIVGMGVLLIQVFAWLPMQAARIGPMDSNIYHHAAQELAAGHDVYEEGAGFIYPPSALLVLKPFGGVSRETFQAWFYVLVLVAFWALAAALAKISLGEVTLPNTLAAGAILQLTPGVLKMMELGNADIFVWALVAWAFAAPRFAGVLLMLGAGLKMYPAVMTAVLCWRASRRFARQSAIAGVCLLVATLVVIDSNVLHAWVTIGLPTLQHGGFCAGDVSLSTEIARVFTLSPHATHLFVSVFPPLVIVTVAIGLRRLPDAMLGAIVMVTIVWTAPICWWWRLTTALLIMGAVWIREKRGLSYPRF